MLTHVVFDLDDTLYPQDSGLWDAIGDRIQEYMVARLGLPPAEVSARRAFYYQSFGTTLNGLVQDFQVEPADYLDFVHDLPLANYIQPDAALDEMLAGLPMRKSIFTNADAKHAQRVLDHIGIAHHFDLIIDIWLLNFINKPRPEAYGFLIDRLGAPAGECVFVEDSLLNLRAARAAGMKTIWISRNGVSDEVDYVVRDVLEVGPIVHAHL